MDGLVGRMIRAARLDSTLYEEVEADRSATPQALWVVVLAAVAGGAGGLGQGGAVGLLSGILVALLGWAVWAGLTYLIGTKLLPGPETKADLGELLRTTGFAASPGVLRILALVPALETVVQLAVGVWMLIAFVIAVRQALDYESTGRALLVCGIGWLVYMGFIITMTLLAIGLAGAGA